MSSEVLWFVYEQPTPVTPEPAIRDGRDGKASVVTKQQNAGLIRLGLVSDPLCVVCVWVGGQASGRTPSVRPDVPAVAVASLADNLTLLVAVAVARLVT